jgi:DNA-binding MarR family transcriptional regulator
VAGRHGVGKRDKAGSGIAAQAERMDKDLAAIKRALRRPLEAEVARGELTVPQSAVMQTVVAHDGISLKDLSREVSLAHSTVSGIVDRLEKRGMIERRADAADGRVTRIHPTMVVRKFVREQIPALGRRPLQAALDRAKADEREELVAAVARLRELLEEIAEV